MIILVDKNNLITSFASAGSIEGGIEISDSILPDGFVNSFNKNKYKYIDGEIIYNNEIKEEDSYTPAQDNLTQNNNVNDQSIEQLKVMVANLQKQTLQSAKLSEQISQQNAEAMQKITELEAEIQTLKEDKGDA